MIASSRSARCVPAARSVRRGSSTRRRARASPTPTAATTTSTSAAASRCSTAMATGGPTSTWRAAATRRRCSATRARPVARCASRRSASPVTDLPGVTGRLPDRHRRRRASSISWCCGSGGSTLLRGLGDCRFEPANESLGRVADDGGHDGVQRHLGRRRRPARPSRSATTWRRSPTGRTSAPTTCSSGRTPPAPVWPPIAARAEVLSAVDAVQRLGRLGATRPADEQRPPVLRQRGGQRTAVAVRARRGAAHLHEAPTAGRSLGAVGDGDRAATTSPATATRRSTSRARARTSSRPSSTARPSRRTTTSRSSDGVDATRPAVGGDPLPSTAWHPEFEDVNNDGLIDLFVSKGNVEPVPDYAMQGPEQPVPRPAGRDVRRRRPRRPGS